MLKTFILASATAAIIAGSSSLVRADTMTEDANTGLNQFYHVGTIAELTARGLPVKDSARAYAKVPSVAAGRRGTLFLLEDRGTPGSVGDQDRKHDSHW